MTLPQGTQIKIETRICNHCRHTLPIAKMKVQRGYVTGKCKPCEYKLNYQWRKRKHDQLRADLNAKLARVG